MTILGNAHTEAWGSCDLTLTTYETQGWNQDYTSTRQSHSDLIVFAQGSLFGSRGWTVSLGLLVAAVTGYHGPRGQGCLLAPSGLMLRVPPRRLARGDGRHRFPRRGGLAVGSGVFLHKLIAGVAGGRPLELRGQPKIVNNIRECIVECGSNTNLKQH